MNGVTVCEQIEPIGDSIIFENDPDKNHGADPIMFIGMHIPSSLDKQGIVMFDLGPTPQEDCETAYANGEGEGNSLSTLCFLDISNKQGNNWGWTNKIGPGTYDWPIYAGAGQCDISKGTDVGNLNVVYSDGAVTITYQIDPEYVLGETHVWVGEDPNLLPKKNGGKWNSAPGQFNYNGMTTVTVTDLSGDIWIAAHSGVCSESQ